MLPANLTVNPPRKLRFSVYFFLVIIICFVNNCGIKVTGNSSEVSNPQLALVFEDSTGVIPVNGCIYGYLSSQNPYRNPLPVFQDSLSGQSSYVLDSSLLNLVISMQSLGKSSASSLNPDSSLMFNVLIESGQNGAGFSANINYHPQTTTFERDGMTLDTLVLNIAPKINYTGSVQTIASQETPAYAFLPGTPWSASIKGDTFTFNGIARNVNELRIITDSLFVYSALETLSTSIPQTFNVSEKIDSLDGESVLLPPVIIKQPRDTTVIAGEPVEFTVVAAGSEPLSYIWQIFGDQQFGNNLSTYAIPVTTLGNSGTPYSVIVSNSAGSDTSRAAVLTVIP